ncbi:MAG: ComF family protein [Akkermansiaceae bacterium]|nr:ComF family protein [Akkermansiaceae bacterium]
MNEMLPREIQTRFWQQWLSRTLDLIYPSHCEICGENLSAGRALCNVCDADLPRLSKPFCEKCGEPFPGKIEEDFACPNCSKLKFSFEFCRPAMVRDDRTLEMIHRLKYSRELHLAEDLGRLAVEAFSDPRLALALKEKWPLVPVPLHWRRRQHRHFNQAEEISRVIAQHTDLPMIKALKRSHATEHQTRLTRVQRLENLRGAFTITSAGQRQIGKSPVGAILVDDVLTTGSTVDECAKTLRRAGFQKVAVITVMRG